MNKTVRGLRSFERKVAKLWEAGKIDAPVHLSGGNESQLIRIFKEVQNGDWVVSTHRNHYHYLLHCGGADRLLEEITAKKGAVCRGSARSMCYTDIQNQFLSTAIVGGGCGVAVGLALALKRGGKSGHVWCFIGDGAVDTGHFYQAVTYAEGHDLPVTFVIEDNDRSTCTSVEQRRGFYPATCNEFRTSSKVKCYWYEPTYPHVGTGKYVQF